MSNIQAQNPTEAIEVGFPRYLEKRQQLLARHLVAGIPDYAFALDQKLRMKLASMWPVRAIASGLTAYVVPFQKQMYQMQGIAVGPKQFPQIYQLGQECARTLGIGTPEIFIYYSPMVDAFTYATEDTMPIIVLSSGIVDALEENELRFIIGHECGHVHNLHTVYNTMTVLLFNPLAQIISSATAQTIPFLGEILQGAFGLFMANWSRAAEVTCDRAGLICCGNPETAQKALAKLNTGGSKKLENINLEALAEQRKKVRASPFRLLELSASHPLISKRVEAISVFSQCEVFYEWHPELDMPAGVYSKDEADQRCEKLLSILKPE